LLVVGTWFHADNYGAGSESRLLKRYLEVGAVALGRELEGFFVLVIGDARRRTAIVLTDIVGSCHSFVRSWPRICALSGSSLLLASLGDFRLDTIGCQEFLRTGIIYEDRTFYQEVHKLGPASVFRFTEGRLERKQRYWQITDLAPESLDGHSAVQTLWGTLINAARKVGQSFARPVCDLTGGYDSRSVVASFLAAGVQFSTTVSGPQQSGDVVISHALAQRMGLSHLHLPLNGPTSFDQAKAAFPFTDGEYDLIEYARILKIHQTLSDRFDISINGSFGEVARGYWWELLFPLTGAHRSMDAWKLARLRYAAPGLDASLFRPEVRLDLVAHFARIIDRANAGLAGLPNTLQMDHAYLTLRMQRWQGRIASSTNQLWPCLSPFLFRSVLETMLQMTTRSRRRGLAIRHMLAEFQPRLAAFPLESGYPAQPFTWRNFHRFWPVPVSYGRRILSKLADMGGLQWRAPSSPSFQQLPRSLLWREEEVHELLHPRKMQATCLIEPTVLDEYLKHLHQQGSSFGDQGTRLLTLEYTLRVLGCLKQRAIA
jgi:hypothetical protein